MAATLASVRNGEAAVSSVAAELLYRTKTANRTQAPSRGPVNAMPAEHLIDRQTVTIRDARKLASSPLLERDGFTMASHRTAVSNLYDEDEIGRLYRPEVEELVKELTGADRVLTFRWKWRSSAEQRRQDVWVEDPVKGVPHIDYNEATVQCFVKDIVGEDEAKRLLRQRHSLINVWRPITMVESKPLTLCDPSTVAVEDLLVNVIVPPTRDKTFSFPLAGYNLTSNPAHCWYYYPQLRPDEALVFKLCDSDVSKPQFTGHTAFDDPTSPPDAAPRESFEIRTIAFY